MRGIDPDQGLDAATLLRIPDLSTSRRRGPAGPRSVRLFDVSTGNQRVLHRARAAVRSTLGSSADAVDLADQPVDLAG